MTDVVEMPVREDERIGVARGFGELSVVAPLRNPAVDEELLASHIHARHRAGHLPYGTDSLEMHTDSIGAGQKILIVDDLLATGGTMSAVIELVEKLGGVIAGIAFVVELTFLPGRERIGDYPILSLVQY